MTFTYNPLDADTREVRLLIVHPAADQAAELNCTLQTVSLLDRPKFFALSYVWGSSPPAHPIILSDSSAITPPNAAMLVTDNVNDALRELRGLRTNMAFWVDAVCINQSDPAEKNVQIPLMGQIYSQAAAVFAWLGKANTNMHLALDWASTFMPATASDTPKTPYWTDLAVKAQGSQEARDRFDVSTLMACLGQCDILRHPYWCRMWTFQEFELPPREPICAIGPRFFSATHFRETQRPLNELRERALQRLSDGLVERNRRADEGLSIDDGRDPYRQAMRELLEELAGKSRRLPGGLDVRAQRMSNRHQERAQTLQSLLLQTHGRRCKDARDRVYALYGLDPAAQAAHPPDYRKTKEDVMLETIEYLVNSDVAGLSAFVVHGLSEDRLQRSDQLSWMIDFSRGAVDDKEPIRFLLYPPVTRALENRFDINKRARIDLDSKTLTVWALGLGRVQAKINFGPNKMEVLATLARLFGFMTDNATMAGGPMPQVFLERSLQPRMARLCAVHHSQNVEFPTEQIISAYDHIFRVLKDSPEVRWAVTTCYGVVSAAVANLVGMAMFITSKGVLGLCDELIELGDEVAMSPRVAVTLVFRDYGNQGSGAEAVCRMVGAAHCDTVTGGEFFDQGFVESLAEEELREYNVI